MKAVTIAVLISVGLAWVVTTAQAALPAPQDASARGVQSAGFVTPQVDAVAATSANPLSAAIIQWTEADVTRVTGLFAWMVVVMLLAYLYECARN